MGSLKRGERVQVMLDEAELEAIDNWRFHNRLPSRAAPVRDLIMRGLSNLGMTAPNNERREERRFFCNAQINRRGLVNIFVGLGAVLDEITWDTG